MKNSELDQLLKSARVPDHPEAYWNEFPRRVMAKAHGVEARAQAGADHPDSSPFGLRFRLRFLTAGLALAVFGSNVAVLIAVSFLLLRFPIYQAGLTWSFPPVASSKKLGSAQAFTSKSCLM